MDFFRSQDIARRNTVRLVVLFLLALISLIAITNVIIMFGLGVFANSVDMPILERIDWRLFAGVSLAILAVVGFGSLYKIISLSGGGARVAEMMQGKLVLGGTTNLAEQKILNVVEEMAIASGTPVPPVYLMEEDAINAFAAGYTPSDAVIGITRGAIEKLSRDELQGVIAHEFSHILHGDMRLNIRLIGILYGIMVLGVMGYYIVRSTSFSNRRSKNGGNIVVVGLGLMVIGYAGTFFGNLIKAAVSRQREFLADASAVQYTRNPDGIADALKQIGSDSTGSVLENPRAAEVSHALFSNGVKLSMMSLFATHPPLEERIRKIQPNWDGNFEVPRRPEASTQQSAKKTTDRMGMGGLAALAMTDALLAQAGNPDEADLQQAQKLLASIPAPLLEASHNAFSARALVYLLLLDDDAAVSVKQMAFLEGHADKQVFIELQKLVAGNHQIATDIRLPLINLCLPTLRQLSKEQYPIFRDNLLTLVKSDGKISLWEWVLQRVVLHSLDAVFSPADRLHRQAHHNLNHLAPECAILLALLIRAGKQQDISEEKVFAQACEQLGLANLTIPPVTELSIDNINASLDRLVSLKPLQKPAFLKACASCIMADGVASVAELEIFRAIAAAIDCPLPPLPAGVGA